MLEAQALEVIDHGVGDGDFTLPRRPTVTIFDARPTPAETNLALGIAKFLLQITAPDFARVIERDDLVPT